MIIGAEGAVNMGKKPETRKRFEIMGGNGSPECVLSRIPVKTMKNGLITVTASMVVIEADLIDFGTEKEQEKLKKKHGITS